MIACPKQRSSVERDRAAVAVLTRASGTPEEFLADLLPSPVFVHVPAAELDFANLDLDDPEVLETDSCWEWAVRKGDGAGGER